MERQTRRYLLNTISSISSTVMLAACDGEDAPISPAPHAVKGSPLPTPTVHPYLERSSYRELDRYQPRSQGEFRTIYSRTRWYNYTDFDFNQPAAATLYAYLEQMVSIDPPFTLNISGRDVDFQVGKRPLTERVVYLISPDISYPRWLNQPQREFGLTQIISFTYPNTGKEEEQTVSFVRVHQLVQLPKIVESREDVWRVLDARNRNANTRLFVEACQGSIRVTSPTSSHLNELGQETFCNALGAAFVMHLSEYDYDLYLELATHMRGEDNLPYVYPESVYQALPTQPVISRR